MNHRRQAILPAAFIYSFLTVYPAFAGNGTATLNIPGSLALLILLIIALGFLLFHLYRLSRSFSAIETDNKRLKQLLAEKTKESQETDSALRDAILSREAAEKKLRFSSTTLENILDNSIPICITNLDHELILANKAYYQQWPAPEKSDGKLQKCYESRPGTLCHTGICPLQQIIDGKTELTLESVKNYEGETKNFILTARPYTDDKGELLGIVETFQDITQWRKTLEEKNKLEKQLSKSQEMES